MKRDRRYDWLAPVYDCALSLFERGLAPHRKELLSRAGGRVLEIGVGTGATLEYYPPGRKIIGVDTSARMLRRAAQKASRGGVSFVPVIMDAQRLAFPGGHFDTVVSSLVLCSVGDPRETLCEIRRVIRPGGRALFIEHVRPSGALGAVFDVANIAWGAFVCQITRRTEDLLEQAGFELVKTVAPLDFLRVIEAVPLAGSCSGR